MYNLNKNNIIQDDFGKPISFIQKIKNKLATIFFNRTKNNLGPSILSKAKTFGKWLVNALRFTYKYLPLFCIFILMGYLLIQIILLTVNNIIPLFVDDFKGWIEFSNKLPYAFHTDLNDWIKFGRVILFFALTMNLHILLEVVRVDLEYNKYPGLSYLVVLFTVLFIISLIIPIWFNWVCGLSIIAFFGYILFTGVSNSESSGGGYSEDYKHETRRDERQSYRSETKEIIRTYKFEEVRQFTSQVTAKRRLYEDGKRTGMATGFSRPGKLISASADQIIIQYGNQWQTYEAQTGFRISSTPAP